MAYRITFKTGVSFVSSCKTINGAKREATRNCIAGFGFVYISEEGASDPIVVKYESDNKWTTI